MTDTQRTRQRVLSMIALVVLLLAFMPTPGAQATTTIDWFGWGVKVNFEHNTWKVIYVTYLGSNAPSPHVVSEEIVDITSHCQERGTGSLTYPSEDSAYFDGTVYIKCNLPSFQGALLNLGYTPPSGDDPFCPCMLGGGPFWADGEIRPLTTVGAMPLLDASDRGVRLGLLVNGNQARTRLEVLRAQSAGSMTFTSPQWAVDPASNRTLLGWHGAGIVAVADHFGWLKYLQDPGWRQFFITQVSGPTIGYWNEPPTTSATDSTTGDYRLGMNGGELYIGYSPSSGQYFTGEIDEVGIDPGCSGA